MNESLKEQITEVTSGLLNKRSIELVELKIVRTRRKLILRFLLDKAGGITLSECAQLNREIGELFDSKNTIEDSYILEVSSPGIDRALVSTRDFERVLGKKIKCVLHQQIEGENVYSGLVSAIDEGCVTITVDKKGEVSIPRNSIARANVEVKL